MADALPDHPGDSQSQPPSDMSDMSDWSEYRSVRVGSVRPGDSHCRIQLCFAEASYFESQNSEWLTPYKAPLTKLTLPSASSTSSVPITSTGPEVAGL